MSFVSEDGGQSFASSIADDGSYSVSNILGGTYKVCVETESLKGAQSKDKFAPKVSGPPKGAKTGPPEGANVPEGYHASNPADVAANNAAKKYIKIPEQYADKGSTPLSYTFKGGSDTYNIELK